jgi:hypothetical protein
MNPSIYNHLTGPVFFRRLFKNVLMQGPRNPAP